MIQLLKIEELIERYKLNHSDGFNTGYIKLIGLVFDFFELQDSFQQKAMNQKEWWKVTELNGKPVNYSIAILGEIGEGIASLDFKWWSGLNEEDKENFITELIDSLHFELSKTMVNIYNTFENYELVDEEKKEFANRIFFSLVNSISNMFGLNTEHSDNFTSSQRFELMEKYIHNSISNGFDAKFISEWRTFDEYRSKLLAKELGNPIYLLLYLMNSYGVNLSGVHIRYVLKNALNVVRKENGYKEGTYQKQWISKTGVIQEDNYVALRLIEEAQKDMNDDDLVLTFDQIKNILSDYYKDFVLDSI